MIELKLYYGEVINNDDSSEKEGKLGRIQVRLLPEMKDIPTTFLPWIRPFMSEGMSSDHYSFNSPEIGDKIWCLFDKYFKEGYYLRGAFIDGFFDYDSVTSSLSNIDETITTTYPHLKFKKFKDGSIEFHNTDTGEIGVYHNTGSYFLMDADGNIILNNKDGNAKIDINSNGITIESDIKITLKTGDAVNWKPCIIPTCIFSGAPHGGTTAGITKLKGE